MSHPELDSKLHVLVVDDVLAIRKLVIRSCQEVGLTRFEEFDNGLSAWEGLVAFSTRDPIDLVISDVTMPIMTGIDLLKRIRADERFKTLPVIMVTAESEKHLILDAIQSGVNQYLMKPFAPPALQAKLAAVAQAMKKKAA